MAHILLLDNLGAFTYNLADQLTSLGYELSIYRNTTSVELIQEKLAAHEHSVLVLSTGAHHIESVGCMPQLISQLKGKVPMVGIGLGFQTLIQTYGAHIQAAPHIAHGKALTIEHDGEAMFNDLPMPFNAGCYHSSAALSTGDLAAELQVNATSHGMIMGARHEEDRMCGFQFHPESILTPQGSKLMSQTIQWALKQPIEGTNALIKA